MRLRDSGSTGEPRPVLFPGRDGHAHRPGPSPGQVPRGPGLPWGFSEVLTGPLQGRPWGCEGFPHPKVQVGCWMLFAPFHFHNLKGSLLVRKTDFANSSSSSKNNCQLFYQETAPPRGACAVGPGSEVDWRCAGVYSQFQSPADTVIQGRSSPLYIVTQYLPRTYSPRIL